MIENFDYFSGTPNDIINSIGKAIAVEDVESTLGKNALNIKPFIVGVYQNINFKEVMPVDQGGIISDLKTLGPMISSIPIKKTSGKDDLASPNLISIIYNERNITPETIGFVIERNAPTKRIIPVKHTEIPRFESKFVALPIDFRLMVSKAVDAYQSNGKKESDLVALKEYMPVFTFCMERYGLTREESATLSTLEYLTKPKQEVTLSK